MGRCLTLLVLVMLVAPAAAAFEITSVLVENLCSLQVLEEDSSPAFDDADLLCDLRDGATPHGIARAILEDFSGIRDPGRGALLKAITGARPICDDSIVIYTAIATASSAVDVALDAPGVVFLHAGKLNRVDFADPLIEVVEIDPNGDPIADVFQVFDVEQTGISTNLVLDPGEYRVRVASSTVSDDCNDGPSAGSGEILVTLLTECDDGLDNDGDGDIDLDDLDCEDSSDVMELPEPGSLVQLAAGTAALFALFRRRLRPGRPDRRGASSDAAQPPVP